MSMVNPSRSQIKLVDRLAPGERTTEIPLGQYVGYPQEILHVPRPPQSILPFQLCQSFLVYGLALGGQFSYIKSEVITWWQLYDDERKSGTDDEQSRDHKQEPDG